MKYCLIKPFKLLRDGIVAGQTQDIAAVFYKTAYTARNVEHHRPLMTGTAIG